ncbi:hypothetical protein EHI8A_077120 [Entamoeba histolytica HM-1:IMSS-B]|uniref:Transmembrane protein n=5 Tax=Entamoeba histolytica TaxID=5759 RepID=C4LVL1_ENTH1|nr:hypothetical protein EHI_103670 [Entamoeba histolytica HM-1:IMSS]EMD48562.1 Hypothetical protein EHI5A_088190 [Entamoeba histolytica KU27]EMH76621.1 hypothetical protein EHI8A_077120 [Entamoeba histolytica HM-1:IMSS-B]ENY60550.1 hypothetical protein EHI7A_055770 [Entamoeba histolytica HM-1:IMSS-A]GAT92708.1 hypothetical protein CL6EHI_103670 [Entamoeba histolytica]EAL43670.1 hypothetical protein EHI_103670 [Entamoeba histolytica HM-1:IMSS]|eukprot:XP_649055.1 hypothetical protein EHI_103670 [Entamoeba histolytica HM-1:IMSS]
MQEEHSVEKKSFLQKFKERIIQLIQTKKKYLLFNIAGVIICIILSILFSISFLVITNKRIEKYYDYHESGLDMRSNALLTSVSVNAPSHIQTCFVSSIPDLNDSLEETYLIRKEYDVPQKSVFFKQTLHPTSSIDLMFSATDKNNKPTNVTLYILKGDKEFQRYSLGLVTTPIFQIEQQSSSNVTELKLTQQEIEQFYFIFKTYIPNTSILTELKVSFGQYNVDSIQHICYTGSVKHDFTAGEIMIVTNTENIYSKVIMDFSGKNVFVNTVIPLSVVLFIFLLITFSVISNRKRRDDEIEFLRHNQTIQNSKRVEYQKIDETN